MSTYTATIRWGAKPGEDFAKGLRRLRDKELENPWKKHDNIPL